MPIIAPPQANNLGDLRLTYPLDLPGVRPSFQPLLSVDYSAQAASGNIALGWSLTIPTITVDSRWGVPVYDPAFETEVYLFKGEQLVPEAGDYFVDPQPSLPAPGSEMPSTESDAADRRLASLQLVPQPNRTASLRPRKTGEARFVLRRDDGLWRFVRHGDTPQGYWWEAWQENPSADVVRVMYFGRAPGHLSDGLEPPDLGRDMPAAAMQRAGNVVDTSVLRVGPMAGLAHPMAISKWGLAREKDSFGNVIDYNWVSSCLLQSGSACTGSDAPGADHVVDRDIYLKRVVYTGHQQVEELILRCRERPDSAGCRRRQGLYELDLIWTPDRSLEPLPLRADARSGGVAVSRRLLERAEVRFRRRQPDGAEPAPIHQGLWDCSAPFLGYAFDTLPDPLFPATGSAGGQTLRNGARHWLRSITKLASRAAVVDRRTDEDALFPAGLNPGGGGCTAGAPLVESDATTSHTTRFDYLQPAGVGDAVTAFGQRATRETALPTAARGPGDRIAVVREVISKVAGVDDDKGPFAPSALGTVETESFSAGIYVGIGGPIKGMSAGYKYTFSQRTSHQEGTLLLDVDGDGIPDVLERSVGSWRVHRGVVNADGNLSFKSDVAMALPAGFRFQHEPVMEATNSGFEGHAFGAIDGSSSGRTHTVQTIQLADMDGDGRVDIVTPGGVFYNASTPHRDGTGRYEFTANTPFLLNGTEGQAPVAPVAQAVPLPEPSAFPSSSDHPRYDVARTWRAPLRGLVRVTGQARLIAPDDEPDAVWGIPASARDPGRAPLDDKLLPPAHRDGVVVAIERASGASAQACGGSVVGPRVLDRRPPPQPGGPGQWTMIGARVANRDAAGSARLDYQLSLSGRLALGAGAADEAWESAILLQPAPPQTAISLALLEPAIQEAVRAWNATYGQDQTGARIGELSAQTAPEERGIRIHFRGIRMPEMPDLRFSLTLPAAPGVVRAGLQLAAGNDPSGSADQRAYRVDTRIVSAAFEPVRAPACAAHPDFAAAEALLAATGIDGGLLVSVRQGDVLSFRVHAIDNGSDDVVTWVPQITYLSAEDASLPAADGTPVAPKALIGPGQPQSPDALIAKLATADDPVCLPDERPALCDVTGRSLLRYRLSDGQVGPGAGPGGDFAPLASRNGGLIAPMTGAVEFVGVIDKPVTAGAAVLDYVVVPVELLTARKATEVDGVSLRGDSAAERDMNANPLRTCDPGVTRIGRAVTIAGLPGPVRFRGGQLRLQDHGRPGTVTSSMRPEAGRYTVLRGDWAGDAALDPVCRTRDGRRANPATCASSGNEFDLRAGDKVCLFLRSDAPGEARGPDAAALQAFWPVDAAGFRISDRDALAIRYNTELATQPREAAPSTTPEPALPDAECVDPIIGDRPKVEDTVEVGPRIPQVQVCRSGASKHFLLPEIQNGPTLVSRIGSVRETAPGGPPAVRPARAEEARPAIFRARLTSPPGTPAPAQTCRWGPGQDAAGRTLYERRFMIDLRGIAPADPADGSIGLLPEPIVDPETWGGRLGNPVASVRSRVRAFRDGQARELPIKRFAAFAAQAGGTGPFRFDPAPLSASALVGDPDGLPDGRPLDMLYDAADATVGVTQVLRFVRGATGTVTLSSFDERREAAPGDVRTRTIQLPSSQVGFAVCAAEDEDLALESALEDRATDVTATSFDAAERLLATEACESLPRNLEGQLDPSESDGSTAPLVRGPSKVCPLGTASVRLAAPADPSGFALADTPLALAYRPAVTGKTPAAAASARWRMPFEALTHRGVSVMAVREAQYGAPDRRPDFRDPVNHCAAQNLAGPAPSDPDMGRQQVACLEATPSVLPGEDAGQLAPLPGPAALRDAMNLYDTISMPPTDDEKKSRLHPPILVLIPEQRYPTPEPNDRSRTIDKQGTRRPAVATELMRTRLCNDPAVPRGPSGTSQATAAALQTLADTQAIGPSLESKILATNKDTRFQAASGTQVGTRTSLCSMSPDPAIWATGETLSASRFGAKDIEFGSKFEAYSAATAAANPRTVSTRRREAAPSRGAGLTAPVRRSDTESHTKFSAVILGQVATNASTTSDQEVIDLNGDGLPDVVNGDGLVLTDPRGGRRCGPDSPWSVTILCRDPANPGAPPRERLGFDAGTPVRSSSIETKGSSFGFPSAKQTAEVLVASARAAFTGSMSGLTLPDKGQRSQESYFPWSLGVDTAHAEGSRLHDIFDVNGDGLPDIVRCEKADCKDASVQLNLGNRFGAPRSLPSDMLIGDRSNNFGLGLSIGWAYPLNDNSFEGGLAGGSAGGDVTRTFVDVNGDGLPDILTVDAETATVSARLNTGWDFTAPVGLGRVDALKSGSFGRSETDNASAGGAYTYSYWIPFTPLWIHINPNAGLGAALTRQSLVFRDVDGDGLPDFIAGDSLLQSFTSIDLAFSRKAATVVPNRLGQHGLLARVWQATNPSDAAAAANLEFAYARTGKTVQDPQHRWVMARATVRDGVVEDDGPDVVGNGRQTCYAYADGQYDRFERQFLGYGRVDTVEGCHPGALTAIEIAGTGWSRRAEGLRRTERSYANGSLYESGLLLAETVFDTSGGDATVPSRSLRQAFVLVDVALSTRNRIICYHPRSGMLTADDRSLLALAFVPDVTAPNRPDASDEVGCRDTFTADAGAGASPDATFDIGPRRLAPALVQSVRETREIASGREAVLTTVLQFGLDHLGRATRSCDLGGVSSLRGGRFETRGALCSDMVFDDSVRPRFTHGATGGGTILVEQRNRIKEVRISDFPAAEARHAITVAFDRRPDGGPSSMRLLRRRSAANDPQTGAVSALCQFTDPGSASDPCAVFAGFPTTTVRLEAAARADVVMRAYRYDEFGNLQRFLGPVGSGGTYLAKAYSFDGQLALVETAERTEHCVADVRATTDVLNRDGTICTSLDRPALGMLRSMARAVDYRHANPTLTIDPNGNGTYSVLDEFGRPATVYANWSGVGPDCGAPCVGLDPKFLKAGSFREIVSYAYLIPTVRVPDPLLLSPAAIVTRRTDPAIYAAPRPDGVVLSKSIHDQFGAPVQSFEEADVCLKAPGGALATDCTGRHNYVASGIDRKDRLDHVVSTAFPVSLGIPRGAGAPTTLPGLTQQQFVPSEVSRNNVVFDGLDRPLVVRLPDGNGYDFRYLVAATATGGPAGPLRHRTEMRNALCVPSAVERDVRGAIRAVIESFTPVTIEGQATAAEGSNPAGRLPGMSDAGAAAAGPVASLDPASTTLQQVYVCNSARGTPFGLAATLSFATYDRDALGQLVAVNLPARAGETPTDAILAGYDALGRRVLIDDPDRGFERIVMDGPGNPVCTYSGERRRTLVEADRPSPGYTDVKARACPDPRSGASADRDLTRLVHSDYLANLPTTTTYKLFGRSRSESDRAAERRVTIDYGAYAPDPVNDNRGLNRVGRPYKVVDMVGVEEKDFDALGRATVTRRGFENLKGYAQPEAQPTLHIVDAFDTWGPQRSRTMTIAVPARASAAATPPPTRVEEVVTYRYTPAGQLVDVVGKSGAQPATGVVSGMQYDARSNLLGLDYATGISTRHAFDAASNRLTAQRTRLNGGGAASPSIYFQNVTYRYDPAGSVLAYTNQPIIAEGCDLLPADLGCGAAIPVPVAKAHGLLIGLSSHAFSYDQLNRIRSAKASLESFYTASRDREGEPSLLDEAEVKRAPRLTLGFEETFAFRPTHEIALMRRAETRAVDLTRPGGKGTSPITQTERETTTFSSLYTPDGRPRHAPGSILTKFKESGRRELSQFGFDEFGRMTASICKRTGAGGCRPDRYFDWHVDDSLRSQIVQVPSDRLSGSKRTGSNADTLYYDHVLSEYDSAGRRTYKRLNEQRIRRVRGKSRIVAEPFVSDTLYADAQLTITRREGVEPRAIVHYFAGQQRLASRWIGDNRLFTYHAQLLTQNVTDVAVGTPGVPGTARLNSQQEYSAFGEILHQRATLLSGNRDGTTSAMNPGLPRYRFNGKEQDETGLQDFGSRFFDNMTTLWLNPDPALNDYLDGKINGGVYRVSNLSSYSFAFGNPVRYLDPTGKAPFDSDADRKYFLDDRWIIATLEKPKFFALYFGGKGEIGSGIYLSPQETSMSKLLNSVGGLASVEIPLSPSRSFAIGRFVPSVQLKGSIFATVDSDGPMVGLGIGPEVSVGMAHGGIEAFHLSGYSGNAIGLLGGLGAGKHNLYGGVESKYELEYGGKMLRAVGDFQRSIEYWVTHPTYNSN